ncbi:glycine zipper domain-containing protein [Maridesulfovibrio hydrothermalis]|uniref:17 kDa surface antigen n=1 Tax=Maridesulfovibrio hydrothermalis AM13 = DSM 14728 TaxID=1121451 RepID=L0R8A6_9BACT|nr:YMGG-like glycine zipper-containing protein [Maridesulfovibrio hydrothermalis]CCO22979.1 17 kDa surface antigen [Maridesulfovibrio hydrothermalis AM13 = DSM 14728]
MKKLIPLLIVCFLFAASGCANKAQTGAGIGALAGATIGALTFKNKASGAAIGAGVGMLMGYIVGNEWDKSDEQQISKTLENNASGQTSSWTNPDTGKSYSAAPSPAYVKQGQVCRDVTITEDGGEQIMAKACRSDDGVWRLQQ